MRRKNASIRLRGRRYRGWRNFPWNCWIREDGLLVVPLLIVCSPEPCQICVSDIRVGSAAAWLRHVQVWHETARLPNSREDVSFQP